MRDAYEAGVGPPLEALLDEAPPPPRIQQGSVLGGRFEILGQIGSGSVGRIFRAVDRILDEPVALKILRPELADQGTSLARFLAEIRLARQVSHPNVCRIYDYGEDGDLRYITMEYLEGTDVDAILDERGGPLTLDEGFRVMLGAGLGLAAIHEAGILHRDLTTSNLMIEAQGRVRVMDFGLAKGWGKRRSLKLTGQRTILGTPEYMSPEQCTGRRLDQRADIYSLGVVCFEVFTGDVPFCGDSVMKTLMAQISDPLPLDRPEVERLPQPLIEVLLRALAKHPDDRYQSVLDMTRALQAAATAGTDRRRHSRLEFPVSCWIRVTDPEGKLLHEERTIAENISRGGVRVRTALHSLRRGDRVTFDEAEGGFRAQSEVLCCRLGRDNIHRLHLRFVEREAPRHLVGTG